MESIAQKDISGLHTHNKVQQQVSIGNYLEKLATNFQPQGSGQALEIKATQAGSSKT